jgi:mannose-6-phosphate isomerase-like protein (cupin superfamily)
VHPVRNYNEAIRLEPNNVLACVNRGLASAHTGSRRKADADFATARQLNVAQTERTYQKSTNCLTNHTAPFDALVKVLEGEVEITIAGKLHRLQSGEMILMPVQQPHALKSMQRFKMILRNEFLEIRFRSDPVKSEWSAPLSIRVMRLRRTWKE